MKRRDPVPCPQCPREWPVSYHVEGRQQVGHVACCGRVGRVIVGRTCRLVEWSEREVEP